MCPNIGECWEEREATFLLLGTKCTRRCGFCDVMTAKPDAVDEGEPARIAETVARMGSALRRGHRSGARRPGRRWRGDLGRGDPGVPRGGARDRRRGPAERLQGRRARPRARCSTPSRRCSRTTSRRWPGCTTGSGPRSATTGRSTCCASRSATGPGQMTKSNLILGMGETPEEVAPALARSPGRRRRHRDDGSVPAADAAAPAGRPLGRAGGVRGARRRGRGRSASDTSRRDRSSDRATTRANSSAARSSRSARERRRVGRVGGSRDERERRSRPVSRILCAGCPAGDHLSRRRDARGGGPFAGPLRSTRKLGRAALERFLLDLAPDGGYRAAAVARRAGGLLPHRCTLTAASPRAAVSFLLPLREVAPAWLAPASCPVESGLSSSARRPPAAARPAPPRATVPLRGLGQPGVDAEVRETVCCRVALARDVLVGRRDRTAAAARCTCRCRRLQVRRLHAVSAGELVARAAGCRTEAAPRGRPAASAASSPRIAAVYSATLFVVSPSPSATSASTAPLSLDDDRAGAGRPGVPAGGAVAVHDHAARRVAHRTRIRRQCSQRGTPSHVRAICRAPRPRAARGTPGRRRRRAPPRRRPSSAGGAPRRARACPDRSSRPRTAARPARAASSASTVPSSSAAAARDALGGLPTLGRDGLGLLRGSRRASRDAP